MEDDKQNSPNPEEPTTDVTEQTEPEAQVSTETPNVENTAPANPTFQPVAAVAPKKSKKKLLLVILLVLLLGGGGAAAWFLLKKDKAAAPSSTTETAQQPVKENSPAETTHAYLFGDKIVAYDAKAKKGETLVTGLPQYAELEDFYIDKDTWRVYYSSNAEQSTKVFLAEKGKEPQQVADVQNVFRVVANAEKKIFAYMTYPQSFTNNKDLVSRTFVVKDGQTKEVYVSNPSSGSVENNPSDLKNSLYNPREISADGSKLLFNRNTCYQCDGPPLASAFELDIATGKAVSVFESKEMGGVTYAQPGKGGYLVYTNKNNNLGPLEGPYDQKVAHLKTAGGTPETLFAVSDESWASARFDPDITQVAVELRDTNYKVDSSTKFDGVYRRKGTSKSELEKIVINGLPANMRVNTLGKIKGDCQLIELGNLWTNETTSQVSKVGLVCSDNQSKYTYTELETKEVPTSQGYTTVRLSD